MKLDAIVKVQDNVAHFIVSPVGKGVYLAFLSGYQGAPELSPPEEIVLVRGLRHWTGSCDNHDLISELGDVIDALSEEAPIFKRDGEQERKREGSGSPEQ